MAGLSSPGLGSGLDINSLITQLMNVEQQPLIALQTREASYQAKISAFGTLKSTLFSLQTAAANLKPATGSTASEKFTSTKATLSDTSLGSVTATNSANAGTYTLSEVSLANAQQLRKSGMTIPEGAGTLEIAVGTGDAVEVAIDAGSSLSDIRDAINDSDAEVTASIINDGSDDFLILTARNSGEANTITVSGSAGYEDFAYAPASVNGWTESVEATDASFKVDGITVTSDKNTISTAIEGVTLTLSKENAGSTTLTISKDHGTISSGISAFIKAFNDAGASIKSLGAYNSETRTASVLTGDSTLRSVESRLRSILFASHGSAGNSLQRLSDIGVNLQLDGTLKLDSTKLTAAVNNDFEGVANLVANMATGFDEAVDGMTDDSGSISSRMDGIQASIKLLDQRQEALQLSLAKVESNYRRQFNALDLQLSNMQSLSARLTSMLAAIPSANSINS